MSAAREAGERYLARVNERDLDGLVSLFAAGAVLLHPVGTFTGHDAIRGFYAENVLAHGPAVTGVSWVEEGDTVVFEMEARLGEHVSYAIDRLTVDADGGIARLAIYYR